MPGVPYTESTKTLMPMYAVTGRFPGWGGLNLALNEEFVPCFEAHDMLNWANRTGLQSDNMGILATRPGYADKPKYGTSYFDTDTGASNGTVNTTYGPVRLLARFFPDDTISQGGQVLRVVQTETGANKTDFQKWHNGTWYTWNTATTAWVDQDDVSNPTTGLGNTYYPESLTLGLPTPLFCFIDPENGLYVYDGSTLSKQEIPRWDTDVGGNITGALWLEQLDGRLVVSGNVTDTGESGINYYCKSGDVTVWTSDDGGGSYPVYGVDSKSKASAPKRAMGLATLHGLLVTFSEDMRYLTAGLGTAAQQTRHFPGEGCFSGKCIVKYKDRLFWWGKDGGFTWSGGQADRISDNIWNKVGNLKLSSAYKWWGYVYMDQWLVAVKYRSTNLTGIVSTSTVQSDAEKYYNFVYDFKDKTWRVFDIPMVAGFSSKGGLTDFGRFYFASPINFGTAQNPAYKCFVYGWDEVDQKAAYADAISGLPGSRTGTAIVSTWETGRNDGGNPTAGLPLLAHLVKHWEKFIIRIDTAGTGAFTDADLKYRLDDTDAYTDLAIDTTGVATPFQHLYFNDSVNYGHLMQARFTVSATKQLILKRLYVQFEAQKFSLTQG